MASSTMVVHVCERGSDAPGLMRYLYGPGRHNEHTDQHMVFGSHGLDMAYTGALSQSEAGDLGHVVEAKWRAQAREQLAALGAAGGGIPRAELKLPEDGSFDGFDREHVYHFTISLPPGQQWTDEQWAQAGWAMVKGLGLSEGPDDDMGCKVVGVRHGQSANGNEHMHVAVNLVREDGRPAHLPRYDFAKVQSVARQVAKELDFVAPLHDDDYTLGSSIPAYTQAEALQAEAAGQLAPDRVLLQQVVRSSALAASNEAEWINAVLDHPGVSLEAAQWSADGQVVTGYVVQIGEGRQFKGYELAPDLTLERMRQTWAGETDQTRADAAALWREEQAPADTEFAEHVGPVLYAASDNLATWTNTITARADRADDDEWADMVRDVAAVTSTVARADDPRAVELTRTATTWSRQAARMPASSGLYGPSRAQVAARQLQLALRSSSPSSHEGWLAVMRQIRQTSLAMTSAANARGELAAARALTATNGTTPRPTQGGTPTPYDRPAEQQPMPLPDPYTPTTPDHGISR